jgi:hypothetical protein
VFNVPQTPTEKLLLTIGMGTRPDVGPGERAQAAADLRRLRADAVVMAASPTHTTAVAAQISDLLGRPAVRVDDVYVWQTRDS